MEKVVVLTQLWCKNWCNSHVTKLIEVDCCSFFLVALTPETAPAGHIAGSVVRQDVTRVGKTGGHDGVRECDRSGELDQGNVVTAA